MRVMMRNALKKIKDAGGLEDVPAAEDGNGSKPTTPKKRGRKPKDVDDEEAEKPTPKKGRGKKKTVKAEKVEDDGTSTSVITIRAQANRLCMQKMRLLLVMRIGLPSRRTRTLANDPTAINRSAVGDKHSAATHHAIARFRGS